MSTICCMLHFFGNRLGHKGSTLYTGAFWARVAGEARTPKKESAIAMAEVLVHPIRIGIDDSSLSPVSIPSLELGRAVTRGDVDGPCRLHFSGQISERVSRYPPHRCKCFPWSPW